MTEDQNSRVRILEAARLEFIKKGLAGARMQEIADHAAINKAMLHYYFGTKEKLYEHVLIDLHSHFAKSVLNKRADNQSAEGLITAIVETMFQHHLQEHGFIKLLVREAITDARVLKRILPQVMTGKTANDKRLFLISEIETLQFQGAFRSDIQPMHIALNIIGLIAASLIQVSVYPALIETNDEALATFLEERKAAVIKCLAQGLLSKP